MGGVRGLASAAGCGTNVGQRNIIQLTHRAYKMFETSNKIIFKNGPRLIETTIIITQAKLKNIQKNWIYDKCVHIKKPPLEASLVLRQTTKLNVTADNTVALHSTATALNCGDGDHFLFLFLMTKAKA